MVNCVGRANYHTTIRIFADKVLDPNLPRIVQRKIIEITKPSGLKQYLMTLPKDYAKDLVSRDVRSLVVAFNFGFVAFPNGDDRSWDGLLEFLAAHHRFREFFGRSKNGAAIVEETSLESG